MAPRSTAIIFPEWRLCVCCRSWRVPPVGEAPGLPTWVLPYAACYCCRRCRCFVLARPTNMLEQSARHRCVYVRRGHARNLRHRTKEFPGIFHGGGCCHGGSRYPSSPSHSFCIHNFFLKNRYQTSARKLNCILRLQLNFRAM